MDTPSKASPYTSYTATPAEPSPPASSETHCQTLSTLSKTFQLFYIYCVLNLLSPSLQVSLLPGNSLLSWRPCEAGGPCPSVCVSRECVCSVVDVCM